MEFNVASMSNANIEKAFNVIAKGIGRNDLGEILFNWNESRLNIEVDKIIGYLRCAPSPSSRLRF